MKLMRSIMLLAVCFLLCCSVAQAEDDYIIAQPGDSGGDVRIILEAAYHLGFVAELSDETEEYDEKYISAIQELEAALSLEADGVVLLSELEAIDGLIYPGMKGEKVEKLLKRMANLGYIKNLPNDQTVYDSSYLNAVKNAEKKLSLNPDGYLTPQEQKVIYDQPHIVPEKVKNLNISSQNGKAVLRWSASKDAIEYCITRDGKKVATVKGTSWTDSDVVMGEFFIYGVSPVRYDAVGTAKTGSVHIEPVYQSIKVNDLYQNRGKNTKKLTYVKISTPRSRSITHEWNGSSIFFLVPFPDNLYVYIYCPNYKHWKWSNANKLPDQSNDLMFTIEGKVSGTKKHNGKNVPIIIVDQMSYTCWD